MSQENPSQTSTANEIWQRPWIGPVVITAVAAAMLARTWQTWPDALVDFGVQLYVPWQITQGKVLYRDIAHYTGPLSVYYDALAFRIFGVNLRVLELANFPILIGTIWAIYFLAQRLGGRLCAFVCGISFVTLFAFAHQTVAGNYNYVCPYEYDYTHGMFLCLLCLIVLNRFVRTGRANDSGVAGFLAGMVFLTRSEFFVAITIAACVGFVCWTIQHGKTPGATKFRWIAFFLTAPMPFLVSVSLLHRAMPLSVALEGTLGMWPALLRGQVTAQHFYHHSMGMDDPGRGGWLLVLWSAAYAVSIAVFAGWAVSSKAKTPPVILLAALLIGLFLAGWDYRDRDWLSFFRPLPLIALIVIAISGWHWMKTRSIPYAPSRAAGALMLGVFSLVLLGKVILYARIIHYGTWLAMPAVMLLIVAVFGWIPRWINQRGGSGAIFVAGLGGIWIAVLFVHLLMTNEAIKTLNAWVGTGADQFRADAKRAIPMNSAITAAQNLVPADKTLACFPEGIMINYLARRRTATRFVNFNPPDLLLFGEGNMVAALEAHPPDFIFIVHKDTSEFGVKYFGRDYGQEIGNWIDARYEPRALPMLDLGAEPLQDKGFGIRLLVPRPEAPERLIYGEPLPRMADSSAADSISSRE